MYYYNRLNIRGQASSQCSQGLSVFKQLARVNKLLTSEWLWGGREGGEDRLLELRAKELTGCVG